jgi:hypothetical protein
MIMGDVILYNNKNILVASASLMLGLKLFDWPIIKNVVFSNFYSLSINSIINTFGILWIKGSKRSPKLYWRTLGSDSSFSLSYIAIILNGTLKYDELMKSNPEAVPDSVKKNFCCNYHRLEKCVINSVSSTPGCEKLLEQYFKKAEKFDAKPPQISLKKLCVKYPIESNDCES